ncbi:MAG: 1-deoxy-D-xylulose-5-phosphate reductoisomerase [Arenicella sp.]|nr:1-deoxy-D-xylulose-5-phosphate reductoisomerase [Arenicella sp.]
MQRIAILGSTGSVGQSTLEVIAAHPGKFTVGTLTANANVASMLEQCIRHRPQTVVMVESAAAEKLQHQLSQLGHTDIAVKSGSEAVCEVVEEKAIDCVMAAIVGAAGLLPTLRAVQAAKRVLIANKEPLVMTGHMFMQEARKSKALILPIDSEHNAIFQCLPGDGTTRGVRKLQLTASGGPFRGRAWQDLRQVTPDQACAHPNWNMGKKISVDSATMMNKGLELIEAAALFNIPQQLIDIVIHPQSVVHSLVEYEDGSFLAQMGAPDMRIPIAHALAWPERIESGAVSMDICTIARLDFEPPDMSNLPCLQLARQAAESGAAAPVILNAANEAAVEAFLSLQLPFTQIPEVIEFALSNGPATAPQCIDDVLQIDHEARLLAERAINSARQ